MSFSAGNYAGNFQTQVNGLPAPGVEGDFADFNPRFTALAGPAGLVAGTQGVRVARFCWFSYQGVDPDNAPTIVNSFGYGATPNGLVPRPGQQSIITPYLAGATMLIANGLPVWVMTSGGLWVKNNGTAPAYRGMKAYANFADGSVSFAATGSPTTAALTAAIAAATAISCTGSIAGNVLTVTAVATGTLVPGAILTGTNVASGTQIVSQLSGTAGGVGTYALSVPEQTVASETIGGTYGILTVSAGTPISGGVLTGSGVTTGTTVWGQLTATTWVVSPSQTVSSESMTLALNVETKWSCYSAGAVGEIVKVSDITQ